MKKLHVICLGLFCVVAVFSNIAQSFAADDLCPQDAAAVKNVPGDAAGVQADIDRLNLCVERAKLLKQLDDIAKQRTDTLNKIKDPIGSAINGNNAMGSGLNSGFGGGGNFAGSVSGLAPLPLNAFPELPAVKNPDLKSGSKLSGGISESSKEIASKPASWKIRKIWGQAGGVSGATMNAQLSDGKGNLLNVTKGDPLPDGSVVDSVSVKGVTLSSKGSKGISKIDDLSWDDAGEASSGSTAPPLSDKLTP